MRARVCPTVEFQKVLTGNAMLTRGRVGTFKSAQAESAAHPTKNLDLVRRNEAPVVDFTANFDGTSYVKVIVVGWKGESAAHVRTNLTR